MASEAKGWKGFRAFLEMIKIEHSVFALPFALIGTLWGASERYHSLWPPLPVIGWIIVAMVSCRSAAMAFNRIADRSIDAQNPRTAMRAIPAGILSLRTANLYFFASLAIFLFASYNLSPLAFQLSPVALLFTLGYSYTKRFTWLCHFVLGLSLGIAPAAAYIAVTNQLDWPVVALFLAVTLWTAGFDIIYALQDDKFDEEHSLHSIPAKFGRSRALTMSRMCHGLSISFLVCAGLMIGANSWFFTGVAVALVLLAYEQSLVKTDDLSRVDMAFFTLNGYVSIAVFVFSLVEQWSRQWQS